MRLIIFDCDGTLVDSQHMIVEAMNAAFTSSGLPAPDRRQILGYVGLSVKEAMQAMTGLTDPQSLAALSDHYRSAFATLRQEARLASPLFPGARETLLKLSAQDDVLLGVATGKSRHGVDHLLDEQDLTGLFATIQTADNAPSKPHPAMIYQAMEETGAVPEQTVMIGDAHVDILMARAASVAAIGVGWGYQDARNLQKVGAERVVENFAELLDHLADMKKTAVA